MLVQDYIDDIRLEITGGVTELELNNEALTQIIGATLREVQRYIDTTELITVPYASCIDLTGTPISSIFRVYRTEGMTGDSETAGTDSQIDPMYVQSWMAFTNGGTMYNLNDYLMNYLSYNTLMQMRNTVSSDLSWKQDHQAGKLYVNSGYDKPQYITIEYVPQFASVEEIKSNYWIDIIRRMAVAKTKIILGRIRSKYKQSSALWTLDGDTLLEEGNKELETLRELLRVNSQIILPID